MARVSKEEIARIQGMQRALEIAKKGGIEALEKEIKFRCATTIPIKMNYDDAFKAIEEVSTALSKRYAENTLQTVMAMAMIVNVEEFDFTDKQLKKFKKKFSENTEQLRAGDIMWSDIQELFIEEYGIDLGFNKDILSIDKEASKRAKEIEKEESNRRKREKEQGKRLRELRTEKKLSQAKLGELVGWSSTYIGNLERATAKITPIKAEKLASALDVSADYLLAKSDRR